MMIDGTRLLVTLTESALIGVHVTDGKLLLRMPFHAGTYNMCTPVVDGQTVICAGRAFAIERAGDRFTARPLWKCEPPNEFNTPVLKEGALFGLSGDRRFYCVDSHTGSVLWSDTTERGECGAFLDAGSVILALTADTDLVVFKPSREAYQELARYKVANTPTYAYPILSGNRIYVKDRDSLTLWAL
jgi:outer membrane protein assembly factor BamB